MKAYIGKKKFTGSWHEDLDGYLVVFTTIARMCRFSSTTAHALSHRKIGPTFACPMKRKITTRTRRTSLKNPARCSTTPSRRWGQVYLRISRTFRPQSRIGKISRNNSPKTFCHMILEPQVGQNGGLIVKDDDRVLCRQNHR